jgi:hypothetical protein
VHNSLTSGARPAHGPTVQLSMPELHRPSRAFMPVMPAVAELSHGRPHAHLRHLITNRTSWRRMGEVCLRTTGTAAVVQGGRIAGFGAYDVTDSKFSISLGPPSCSPPV